MTLLTHAKGTFLPAALLVVPVVTNGCGTDITEPTGACCTEFRVGADLSGADFGVDPSIKGRFSVLAQAASDFSATATGMVDDVTNACRGIAQDLGADAEQQDAAEKETDPTKRAGFPRPS